MRRKPSLAKIMSIQIMGAAMYGRGFRAGIALAESADAGELTAEEATEAMIRSFNERRECCRSSETRGIRFTRLVHPDED